MKLLIDAGNTRIKWALVHGESWLCSGDLPAGRAEELARGITGRLALDQPGSDLHAVQQIWVSNVAGEALAQHVSKIATGRPAAVNFVVARKAQCGVSNAYADPAQLGSDRWAALIAAWHLLGGECMVVNSGTATTIDALSGRGEFLGGLILPGVELMQRSLVAATDQLKTEPGGYAPYPRNSADGMYSGAIQASCGAIERQYAQLDSDRAQLLLSGGAAALLLPHLDSKRFAVAPLVVDNLVLQGLLVMAGEADAK